MDEQGITSNSGNAEASATTSATSPLPIKRATPKGSRLTGQEIVSLVITALVEQCRKAGITIKVLYTPGASGLTISLPELTVVNNEIKRCES